MLKNTAKAGWKILKEFLLINYNYSSLLSFFKQAKNFQSPTISAIKNPINNDCCKK